MRRIVCSERKSIRRRCFLKREERWRFVARRRTRLSLIEMLEGPYSLVSGRGCPVYGFVEGLEFGRSVLEEAGWRAKERLLNGRVGGL
jgi:hypothetical protein